MARTVEIFFSKDAPNNYFHDSHGTSKFNYVSVDLREKDCAVLIFDLIEHPISENLYQVCNSTSSENAYVHSNTYGTVTMDDLHQNQVAMNEVISNINNIRYKDFLIPDSMILDMYSDDQQIDKLNSLHRFFEDVSYDVIKYRNSETQYSIETTDYLFQELEKVNYLVHSMEKDISISPTEFVVIRNVSIKEEDFIKLNDNDYELFKPLYPHYSNALLFIDYSTVGKDLEACYFTNDIELVRQKELKQQEFITSALNYQFNGFGKVDYNAWEVATRISRNNYRQWCEENDVGDYYDYWLPKYNLGRIPIGTCRNISDYAEYKRMITDYPYMIGIRVK